MITDQITRLEQAKIDITQSIIAKGVSVPENSKIDTLSPYIDQISSNTGGSVDKEGLARLGYSNEEISWFQKQVFWSSEYDYQYVIPEQNFSEMYNPVYFYYIPKQMIVEMNHVYNNAFAEFTNLKSLYFTNSTISFGNAAFYKCRAQSIRIPDTITTISQSCFEEAANLITLDIPDSVTTIGADAFKYCYSLCTLKLPINSNLIAINGDQFFGCISLKYLKIPPSITVITGSFINTGVNVVDMRDILTVPTLDSSQTFVISTIFYIPKALESQFRSATNWTYHSENFIPV